MQAVRFGWMWPGTKVLLALAAAFVIPACGTGDDGLAGTDGTNGTDGLTANPPAAWSAPANLSNQVIPYNSYAYGQQAVFSSDGRMHVVYYGYNPDNDSDQLFYTNAAPPYETWSSPVLVSQTDDTPDVFDLTAGEDGTAQIAFARYFYTGMSDATELVHVANTPGALLTFTETQVFVEPLYTSAINSTRILMRGSVAHVVWGLYTGEYDDYYYSNSAVSGGWPTLAPTLVEAPSRDIYSKHYTFAKDASGKLHLAYYYDNSSREVRYRSIASGAGSFSLPQSVSDSSESTITIEDGAPIVQFDGSNNVFVFYKRWDAASYPWRAILMNSKSAAGSFAAASETVVTESPNGDEIPSFGSGNDWAGIVDVQVTSAGAVHAAWRSDDDGTTNFGYPVYYRYKAPGVNPASGWDEAQVAAYSTSADGASASSGAFRSVLVRPATGGDVNIFYSESVGFFGPTLYSLMHAFKPVGEAAFRNGGNVSGPTNVAGGTGAFGSAATNYFVDAGVDENGLPYVLMETFYMSGFNSISLSYTHRWANQWIAGVDVNGVNVIGTDDGYDVWSGHDPDGRLHVLWRQVTDPFNSYAEDVMHSNTLVESQTFWGRIGFSNYSPFGGGP